MLIIKFEIISDDRLRSIVWKYITSTCHGRHTYVIKGSPLGAIHLMISKKFQKILYIHDYLHQWSDSHDDHTLDCGIWVKGLHAGKKMH